ncbi:MAG: thrombospondin type 3 repeat-containing protein [Myxococcota bacterium]
MKKLIPAALFLVSTTLLGTGCFIVDSDDDGEPTLVGDDTDGDGIADTRDNCPAISNPGQDDFDSDGIGMVCDPSSLIVYWDLVAGDANEPANCPEQTHSLQVISQPADGDAIVDLFSCSDFAAYVPELSDGEYTVYINLLDESEALIAQSAAFDIAVDSRDQAPQTLEFLFSLDRGSFGFTWSLAEGENTLTCAEAGVEQVLFESTRGDDPEAVVTDRADCLDGQFVVPALALGGYNIAMTLLDTAGGTAEENAVGESILFEGALEFGNHYLDFGEVVFDLGL